MTTNTHGGPGRNQGRKLGSKTSDRTEQFTKRITKKEKELLEKYLAELRESEKTNKK